MLWAFEQEDVEEALRFLCDIGFIEPYTGKMRLLLEYPLAHGLPYADEISQYTLSEERLNDALAHAMRDY